MVTLNRIYTRTGDDGTTALGTGERRPKYDLRISSYGTVDETNAAIGVARLHVDPASPLSGMLAAIQNDLFDVGADLAVPDRPGKAERLRIVQSQVERLEAQHRRIEREPCAAHVIRVAGRSCRGGVSACRPHRLPPRRTADGRACRPCRRAGEPRGA